jgi:hypothetical protein
MLSDKHQPEIFRLEKICAWAEARVQRAMLAQNREQVERATQLYLRMYFRADKLAGEVQPYNDFN